MLQQEQRSNIINNIVRNITITLSKGVACPRTTGEQPHRGTAQRPPGLSLADLETTKLFTAQHMTL